MLVEPAAVRLAVGSAFTVTVTPDEVDEHEPLVIVTV